MGKQAMERSDPMANAIGVQTKLKGQLNGIKYILLFQNIAAITFLIHLQNLQIG